MDDNPSDSARWLKVTKKVGAADINIFCKADRMGIGIPIITGDEKFLRGPEAQGVEFDAMVHGSHNWMGNRRRRNRWSRICCVWWAWWRRLFPTEWKPPMSIRS
ncbi:hypothetical protein [Streptomyces sp. NRRL S-813]|uniref:hypothetical protein n=1 Tax=Streptomyces sp. NRRL S-813 TaxID=1463919 RepID=UPI0018FF6284|nr:hypothetical protein [Streptomyces sp. NRRL S-813]